MPNGTKIASFVQAVVLLSKNPDLLLKRESPYAWHASKRNKKHKLLLDQQGQLQIVVDVEKKL